LAELFSFFSSKFFKEEVFKFKELFLLLFSTSLSSSTSSSLVFACVRLFLFDLACFDCFHQFLQAFLFPCGAHHFFPLIDAEEEISTLLSIVNFVCMSRA